MNTWSCNVHGRDYQVTSEKLIDVVNMVGFSIMGTDRNLDLTLRALGFRKTKPDAVTRNPDLLTRDEVEQIADVMLLTVDQLILHVATCQEDGSDHKDCPFCGSSPMKHVLKKNHLVHNGPYTATFGCSKCSARVTAEDPVPAMAWLKAAEAWDARA